MCSLPFASGNKCRMDTKQQTDITVRLCTTEHLVFLFGAHFVSCRFISRLVLLFVAVSFVSHRLSCSCDGFSVFFEFSFFLVRYFNFFPAFAVVILWIVRRGFCFGVWQRIEHTIRYNFVFLRIM